MPGQRGARPRVSAEPSRAAGAIDPRAEPVAQPNPIVAAPDSLRPRRIQSIRPRPAAQPRRRAARGRDGRDRLCFPSRRSAPASAPGSALRSLGARAKHRRLRRESPESAAARRSLALRDRRRHLFDRAVRLPRGRPGAKDRRSPDRSQGAWHECRSPRSRQRPAAGGRSAHRQVFGARRRAGACSKESTRRSFASPRAARAEDRAPAAPTFSPPAWGTGSHSASPSSAPPRSACLEVRARRTT